MSKEKCVLVKESEYNELKKKVESIEEPSVIVEIQFSNNTRWDYKPFVFATSKSSISLSDGLLSQLRRISSIITDVIRKKTDMMIEELNKTHANELSFSEDQYRRKIRNMSIAEFIMERRRLRIES